MTVLAVIYGIIVLLRDIIIMLLDKNYANASNMVPFLLLFPVMYSVSEATGCGIGFARKTTYQMIATGVAALTNFLGNYWLVPSLGGLGASISTGISFVVFFWLKTLFSRKLWFNFDLFFYFINIFLILSLAIVSVFFDIYLLEIFIFALVLIYNKKHIKYLLSIMKSVFIELLFKRKNGSS